MNNTPFSSREKGVSFMINPVLVDGAPQVDDLLGRFGDERTRVGPAA